MPRLLRENAKGKVPERLKDPCKDRKVSAAKCPLPPAEALGKDPGYAKDGKPDLDLLREHLMGEGALTREFILDLIDKAADLLDREPNMLKVSDPITIVGDIHGQYWDSQKLFEVGGDIGGEPYLFLGDYVDRGAFSLEVVLFLFAAKIRYPDKIYMLRGNHECRRMTRSYGFKEECEYKYDIHIYNVFMEAFDVLPFCAVVDGKYFCAHAGISPELADGKMEDKILAIDRMHELPYDGIMNDLIWSDPNDKETGEAYTANTNRDTSYFYSLGAAASFLKTYKLRSIIRGHEVMSAGYKMHKTSPGTTFPSVITVFSAPNYCDSYHNKAAILKIKNSTVNVLQFSNVPHPHHLPDHQNCFAMSMPFIIEKVMEFASLMFGSSEGHVNDEEVPDLPESLKRQIAAHNRGSLTTGQNDAVALAQKLNAKLLPTGAGNDGGDGGSDGDGASDGDGRSKAGSKEAGNRSGSKEGGLTSEKVGVMKRKALAMGKMAVMMKKLREESQLVLKLKGVCPGHKLHPGVILEGKKKMLDELAMFEHMMEADRENELKPDSDSDDEPMVFTKTLTHHSRKTTVDVAKAKAKPSPKDMLMASYQDGYPDGGADATVKPEVIKVPEAKVLKWSNADVKTWLSSLGLSKLHAIFEAEDIAGDVLLDLDEDDLEYMGIPSEDVKHLGGEIQALKAKHVKTK